MKAILPMFGDNFVLKGGTSLILYYGCDRYSEDIDLDSKSQNMNFINRIHNPGYDIWNINIKKDTPTVFRVMIDYGAKSYMGDYPLKIEVSSRNSKILSNTKDYVNIDGVNVYKIEKIAKMKINAIWNRTKPRDFYDIGYPLRKHINIFTLDDLANLNEAITMTGIDEWSALLDYDVSQNHLINLDSDEYVLNTVHIIENQMDKLISKNKLISWD